ncbi:hypothetical protein QQP08_003796 [Theobroma cacao]|nr:hypothetical protein QQP08_003796 [Theobroma cacao]
MLLTLGIIILALLGLIFAAIVISAFLICCNKVIRERLRGPLHVIETGQQGNLVQPPEKQQGVMPILAGSVIIYKNGETESNCTDCAIYLEEFKEGDRCRAKEVASLSSRQKSPFWTVGSWVSLRMPLVAIDLPKNTVALGKRSSFRFEHIQVLLIVVNIVAVLN